MSTQIPLGRIASASAYSPSHGFLSERSPSPPSPTDIEDVFIDGNPHPADPSPDDIHPRWKRRLHHLLEHPTSSPSAFLLHWCITGLILFSALVTTLETVPAFHAISGGVWFGLESSLVALFTVEYLARCIAWSYSWSAELRWVGSFFGILDLLAILPYYIEIAMQEDTVRQSSDSSTSPFDRYAASQPSSDSPSSGRSDCSECSGPFAIAVLFSCTSRCLLYPISEELIAPGRTIEVMFLSFRRSQHALLALSFFVCMVLIVFSTLLYFIERGSWDATLGTFINSDGDPSQFASIPAAAWFVIVTITTVGYGEITPRSFLGRLITLPLLVFGLLLIALPSFVLGREFSIVWNEMTSGQMPPDTPHFLPQSPQLLRTAAALNQRPRRDPGAALDFSASLSHLPARAEREQGQDLTNRKLAQNQTALSAQIGELRALVERQEELLRLLLARDVPASPQLSSGSGS